jgi:hypothetical protein
MKSRPPPRPSFIRNKALPTFADIRRNAEKQLALGLQLDFHQIMLEIAELRARDAKSALK